jgi:N-acetylglucosaminyldiphosphoundecaprenol N-acetyl-beta-D-mannosaminyltransferase
MINQGKKNLLGILVNAIDYECAIEQIMRAAYDRRPFPVSCAPVHSIMEGALHEEQRYRMNRLGMVVPDGMPVRWALNILHHTHLLDRVRGTTLASKILARAEQDGIGMYFYGNKPDVLEMLRHCLHQQFPNLRVCGMEPSKFRTLSATEKNDVARRIRRSGASLVFVGLGTPLQDIWAYEYASELSMPILCIGGAFNVIAGCTHEAPAWMQTLGLEWLFRLAQEPRRLWRRYVLLNPMYVFMVILQGLGYPFESQGRQPDAEVCCG